MSRPLTLALLVVGAVVLIGVSGVLWLRYGAAVFLSGGTSFC